MTKIDIYSGFLGAGKTTLIKKLVAEAYKDQQIVIIENEFGEIGIDGGFLKDAGVEIREMNSGCICCSLTGDFKKALAKVVEDYHPDRIIIEPSGVGKLSEVAAAVLATGNSELVLGGLTAVVDAVKCKMYLKNFGEFFNDQVETAHCIVLSRTQMLSDEKLQEVVNLLKAKNPNALFITADWASLAGSQILEIIDGRDSLSESLEALMKEHLEHEHEHHHHHHHEDGEEHDHEHHHHDDDECDHHHDDEHEHHHHHDDDEECSCGCGHHHHHGHDADEVFASWGTKTAKRFTETEIEGILKELENSDKYGMILRAKGIVEGEAGSWIHFDYTPGEPDVRKGPAAPTGVLCVIGSQLKEDLVKELFGA